MKPYQKLSILIFVGFVLLSFQSKLDKNEPNIEKLIYQAFFDFEYVSKNNNVPFYKDKPRICLAINAVEYKDKFSTAVTTFRGKSGLYDIKFTSMKETDGESTYSIKINGKQIGEFQNPATEIDYELNHYSLSKIYIQNGQLIEIDFNSHSNGIIPEGEGFAYSRGRWRAIEFSTVE